MPTGTPGNAMSVAERTRRHRARARRAEIQAALAAARLVSGRDPGDAARSLSRWLERIASRDGVEEEEADEIRAAAAALMRRRR